MTKQAQARIIEELNLRFQIAKQTDEEMGNGDKPLFLPNNPDAIHYKAMLKTIELAGYWWKRFEGGKHAIGRI